MKKKGPSQRMLRVGELVRHALMDVLTRETLPSKALAQPVSISEVRMSADLKIATVFVAPPMIAPRNGKPVDVQTVIAALAENAAFLRGRMAPHLDQMRAQPNLRFREDTSFENYAKIDALLKRPGVAQDLAERPANFDRRDTRLPEDMPTKKKT